MQAKTLNINKFKKVSIVSKGEPTQILIKAEHNGHGFIISEALVPITQRLEAGSIAKQYKEFKKIFDTWYEAALEPIAPRIEYLGETQSPYIVATGYISILRNGNYISELEQAEEIISSWKTKKEQKEN